MAALFSSIESRRLFCRCKDGSYHFARRAAARGDRPSARARPLLPPDRAMGRAVARRPHISVDATTPVRLPPLKPADETTATARTNKSGSLSDRPRPVGGLALAPRRQNGGDVALARARALRAAAIEAKPARLSTPPGRSETMTPRRLAPLPSTPKTEPRPPSSPSSRRTAPRARPRNKDLTPIKMREASSSRPASSSSSLGEPPLLPPPSLAERGGKSPKSPPKSPQPRPSRRAAKAAAAAPWTPPPSSPEPSSIAFPALLPAPPPLPVLPPPWSQPPPLEQLHSLFWNNVGPVISADDEPWKAVRMLIMAGA